MNPKIKELAEKAAGTKKHVPPVWQFFDDELEKFAELIVKECARIMFEYGKTYAHPSAGEYQAMVFSNVIKEHFYGETNEDC